MTRFLSIAATEMLILRRNRWLLMATIVMVLFALALTFAGSAPTGTLGVDMLTISVTSMTTLSVYLAPLLALMISFDAIAGEAERGSLSLLLSYPAGRGEILLGKFAAHLADDLEDANKRALLIKHLRVICAYLDCSGDLSFAKLTTLCGVAGSLQPAASLIQKKMPELVV